MHLLFTTTFLFLFSLPTLVLSLANATNVDTKTCNPAHNGLAAGTLQYTSDCNATTWCDNGVCRNKGCRKDEFPLGYNTGDGRGTGSGRDIPLPTKCSVDEFCPDEGSQCVQKLPVGQPCQFDRDDSCEGPSNFKELRDTSGTGLNVNGSICLNFVCQFANVTAGSHCEIENTGYIGYGSRGEFVYVVSRDNCKIGLYCDTNSTVCMQQRALGASCTADKECSTYNCLPNQVCGLSPSSSRHFPLWIYVIIGFGIIGGMVVTLVILFLVHGRQREDEREKRLQYWREQNAFRQNILQMHESAQASLFSTTASRRSVAYSLTEDPNAPILQHAAPEPKSFKQRHPMGEESGSFEASIENEQLVMRTPYMHNNKF